jgi:hypothetical protein
VTVIGRGDGRLTAAVGESGRSLVESALRALLDAAAQTPDSGSGHAERERVVQLRDLHDQLQSTSGPVELTGSEVVVVEVIKSTAGNATHDLDVLVEFIRTVGAPLTDEAMADLRSRLWAVCAAVEALIAAESSRSAA